MGNAQSPPNDPRYLSASRAFSQKELQDLKSLFNSLASQSQSNGKYISPSIFQSYFKLHGPVGERMFDLVTQERKDQKLTFEDLVITKATYEKGTKDEIEEFIFRLLDVSGDNFVGRSDLESVMIAIFNDILCIKGSEDGTSSHQDIVNIFLYAATFSIHDEKCTEEAMSFEDFRSWCTHLPTVRKLLGSLLLPPDSGRPGTQIPNLLTPKDIDSNIVLLRKEYAWHIGGALSQHELEDWKLLYHSYVNGLSFNTFLGNISNHEGPTVLIIKDKDGYIYGGYASQQWERHAEFYGDMKSYIFQLNPKASIFRPTGANTNLQWAWLDPLNIPSGKSSVCDFCGDPLQFLLQVYASVVEKESTFHRMLFVFMCPSMTCLLRDQHEQWKRNPEKPSRSVKVFRCQLPRVNPFYSSECPKYDGSDKPTGSGAALCDWCGTWKGNKLCSSCKQVRYCSEKHQSMSWRAGHKIACQQIKVSSPLCGPNKNGTTSPESCKVGNKSTWPEFEIIEDQSECNGDKSEDNTLANSLILRNRSDDTMNSLMDVFQGDDDKKSWAHFQERIAKAPEQVLRYYRNSNSKPIWPILSGRPSKDDIPKCIYCGGSMCCEFQILPQLLYYFGVENEVNSLDWASIVVYACEASCEASLPYKHEYAWVQLYSPSACPMPQ